MIIAELSLKFLKKKKIFSLVKAGLGMWLSSKILMHEALGSILRTAKNEGKKRLFLGVHHIRLKYRGRLESPHLGKCPVREPEAQLASRTVKVMPGCWVPVSLRCSFGVEIGKLIAVR